MDLQMIHKHYHKLLCVGAHDLSPTWVKVDILDVAIAVFPLCLCQV